MGSPSGLTAGGFTNEGGIGMFDRQQVRVLTGALLGLLVLAALVTRAGARDGGHKHNDALDRCAKRCSECARECDSCFHHCAGLVTGGKKEHAAAMHLCVDCAELCTTAGRLVSRQSPLTDVACEACARACDACAAACEKFPADEHMTQCAAACRECAKTCREMVKHLGK